MNDFDAKTYIQTLPARPGAYRMFGEAGEILYVGKAKNLKNRLSSYFRTTALDYKTLALVARFADIEITVTASETEALLLEQSLIKEYRPPYNIVFRDDKSYPYIYLASEVEYPRLAFHRGAQKNKGRYFGPFPSAYSVRDSLNILQKVFRVRQCEDTFFKNRSRPCLQYQIKRCSGPCCGFISPEDYADDVEHAVMFLEGRSKIVMDDYADKMESASSDLDFERAAQYRDQISHLRRIQEQQYVVGDQGDIDVIATVISSAVVCVLVMFIRGGRLLGNKTYFPKTRLGESESQILEAFLPQFYFSEGSGREIPGEIIVSSKLETKTVFREELTNRARRKVSLSDNVRSRRRRWLDLAITNAEQSLGSHLANQNNLRQRYQSLQDALALDEVPTRLECFDISHSSGEAAVASCVVFDHNGPLKSAYRRFNIEGITPGDDYAAMAQALNRRYTRLKKGEGQLPDILLIDGGKGHLGAAEKVLEELQVEGVLLVAVAKGVTRKAGLESLIVAGNRELNLLPHDPALHLIQHIRDESHRFAITAHRNRRGKRRTESVLESIEGVGPKRRRSLLRHFGSLRQVQSASVEELAKVEGVNQVLAEYIYASLHNQ